MDRKNPSIRKQQFTPPRKPSRLGGKQQNRGIKKVYKKKRS